AAAASGPFGRRGLERTAGWFAAGGREGGGGSAALNAGVRGRVQFAAPAGVFTVTATADRIECGRDGALAIIDYKTGSLPKPRDIEFGFSPQLPLEAAIATAGGFTDIREARVASLQFWRLTGGNPPAEIKGVKADPMGSADAALAGLKTLVAAFDSPDTAYHSEPDPEFAPRFSDYGHLARVKEWSAGGPEEVE